MDEDAVPMVYPYLTDDTTLRQRLIDNQIFVAKYWSNIAGWCQPDILEYKLMNNLISLPINQRYGVKEMDKIIKIVLNN
jgi:hypothetical protein